MANQVTFHKPVQPQVSSPTKSDIQGPAFIFDDIVSDHMKIARYQLLELLFRIAQANNPHLDSHQQAGQFFNHVLLPRWDEENLESERKRLFYSKLVDKVLSGYTDELKFAFKLNSTRTYMSLEECEKVLGTGFEIEKEKIQSCYAKSLRVISDEVEGKDQYFKMGAQDFQECMLRAALEVEAIRPEFFAIERFMAKFALFFQT